MWLPCLLYTSLVVDLENSIKAQQSAGYERWAKIHKLKQAATRMNFLTENKIEYYSELESKIADIMTDHEAAAKAVKDVEQRLSLIHIYISHKESLQNLPVMDFVDDGYTGSNFAGVR